MTPAGASARWAADERKPENVPAGMVFSTSMPGGDENLSCTLARQPERAYPDLEELATIHVRSPDRDVRWTGRLEQAPKQSGPQLTVTPTAVGRQADLADDNSARMIFLDSSFGNWQGASVGRQIAVLGAADDLDGPSSSSDWTQGTPALVLELSGPWSRAHIAEAWYDAKGLPIGKLLYAWKQAGLLSPSDVNWAWDLFLSDDDVAGSVDLTANLRAAGPGSGVFTPTTTTRKFAGVQLSYATFGGSSGVNYPLYWALGVMGNHGLTLQGTFGFGVGNYGLLASDIIKYVVGRWASSLGVSVATSAFWISQAVYPDPTTAAAMLADVTKYELQDWGVWWSALQGKPTFFWGPRGSFGKTYKARVGPSGLQETGPQIDRLYNGVIVTWTDVLGISRSAGPVGSGCTVESALLSDPDPLNPANQAGVRRWSPPLQLSVATPGEAIQCGQLYLQQQKQASTSGTAALVGWVEDDKGVWWPASKVRGGDCVQFIDASDSSPRRVVRTDYTHDSRTNQVTLDSPPDALQQILERLGARISALGL